MGSLRGARLSGAAQLRVVWVNRQHSGQREGCFRGHRHRARAHNGLRIVVNLDNARYMNHSDTPNLIEVDGCNYTARDIAEGEELTCDYRVFDAGLTLSGAFLKR
ncbi:MAG: hypothetical protein CVV14_06225 [Gammaproteobacteria bacterium HGW-Gammaproteobacteria-4]|nr:MAG: hypothetical protein CVV14_06225 [Gammaproteobacteria bacterium HGW-Gammaproteobacteria-4]